MCIRDSDPSLNLRIRTEDLGDNVSYDYELKQPLRVVLDTNLKTSPSARILALPGNTLIYSCSNDNLKRQKLNQAGAEIKTLSGTKIALDKVLKDLAKRQINEVHVEAGATLCGALLEEKQVDEIIIYMAATILGGNARSLFNLPQLQLMKDKINVEIKDIRAVGNDWRITAVPIYD